MKNHICKEIAICTCYLLATEPDEKCYFHGSGPWPPRCSICGRFLSWDRKIELSKGDL
jgi:hypothetical protein